MFSAFEPLLKLLESEYPAIQELALSTLITCAQDGSNSFFIELQLQVTTKVEVVEWSNQFHRVYLMWVPITSCLLITGKACFFHQSLSFFRVNLLKYIFGNPFVWK